MIPNSSHDGGDQSVMLAEAVDDLNTSRVALEILCCEPMKESRVNGNMNGLNPTSVALIPADFGRLPRRSQSDIPRAAESRTPAISTPDLGLPRSAASCEYQPGVRCGRNSQVTAACGLPGRPAVGFPESDPALVRSEGFAKYFSISWELTSVRKLASHCASIVLD